MVPGTLTAGPVSGVHPHRVLADLVRHDLRQLAVRVPSIENRARPGSARELSSQNAVSDSANSQVKAASVSTARGSVRTCTR